MIYPSFDLEEYNLIESDIGMFKLPTEIGEIKGAMPWRAFSLMLNRWYSHETLEQNNDIKVNIRSNEPTEDSSFISMVISFNKTEWNQLSDTYIKNLVSTAALEVCFQSKVRYCSGTRATFVYEYLEENKLLVIMSTSVFFNDFRVTTNAPCFNDEFENDIEDPMLNNMKIDIQKRLCMELVDVNFSIESFELH